MAGERPLPGFHGDQITSFVPGRKVKNIDEDSATRGFAFHLAALSARSSEEDSMFADGN